MRPANLLFAASILLSQTACDDQLLEQTEIEDFRSIAWDSVVCTAGPSDRCYAHSPSAKELWQPVVSWCDLHERVEAGGFVPTNDGWDYACDPDGQPETFSDVLCFHNTASAVTECFGGHDGWYVRVEPSCAPNGYTVTPWPAGACDVDGVGYHEYDTALVHPAGPKSVARATDGGDAFKVVPECAVPLGGVVGDDPFSCDPDAHPCCSCDGEGSMDCVDFDYGHVCPAGSSTTTMACE